MRGDVKVYAVNRVTGERELLGDLEDFPACDCDQLAGECCAKCCWPAPARAGNGCRERGNVHS